MKRSAIRVLVLVAAVLLLGVSCYWTPQDAENVEGSLSLDMSGIATQADVTGDTARVYLLAERDKAQGLYPLGDGEDYVDVDVDDSLTIDGIAPGYSYRVLISFGTDQGSWFEVSEYAESDPVEVESGSQTEVEVKVKGSPFTYPGGSDGTGTAFEANGKSLNGVVFDSTVFVADSGSVYDLDPDLVDRNQAPQPIPAAVNSLSRGGSRSVLVNTQAGVYDLNSGAWTTGYTGAATLSAEFGGAIILQGPGTIAAAEAFNDDSAEWAVVDVGDAVAGDPIRDYAVDGNDAAIVTALGSFSTTSGAFTDIDKDSTWDDISDPSNITFIDQDIPARILSVGYGGGGTLYVGTDDGVYESDGTRPPFDSASTIISKIAADGTSVAFLGPYYLFIYDGASVQRYPFVAGFPGNPNDMTWGDNGGTDRLYVTGDEGIVSIAP